MGCRPAGRADRPTWQAVFRPSTLWGVHGRTQHQRTSQLALSCRCAASCEIRWLAGGRERGAQLSAQAAPRCRLFFDRAPSGAVHGRDPPSATFAIRSKLTTINAVTARTLRVRLPFDLAQGTPSNVEG